jgi:hypothetical protein
MPEEIKKEEMKSEMVEQKEPTMTEQSAEKTTSHGEYREANESYMKSMYPDTEINDGNYDEMVAKTMAEHFIPKMKGYQEANEKLRAMMTSEPELGKILADMAQGAKFVEILPRYVDVQNLKLEPGDPDYSTWEANNKARMESYHQNLDRQTQLQNNQRKSMETIASWFEEKGFGDEDQKGFTSFVSELLDRAYSGEITPEFLNKMYYAMNYEEDVKKAEEVGAVKGRNEKIVVEDLEESAMKAGDGMPVITGGVSAEKEERPDNADPLTKSLRGLKNKKSVLPGNTY